MVGSLPPIKGMSAYCLQQVQALSKLIEIDFINFKSIYPPIIYPIEQKEEDKVFQVELNRNIAVDTRLRWYHPAGSCWAGFTIKNRLVHFHWWTSFLFIVFYPLIWFAKRRGRKVVCTVHNVLGHESGALDQFLCRRMLSLPDVFIVHSDKNKTELARVFDIAPERVFTIPHGRYDFYSDRPVGQDEAKEHLGIDKSSKVVLFFGHVRDYKGVDTLFLAIKNVKNDFPDVKCVVAGKNWVSWQPFQQIIDAENLHDNVIADLQYVPSSKVKYYFSAADLVVLPYKQFDSQSGPGNIAIGFNKPLVVSNVGALPDLVMDKSVIFEPGDVAHLSELILRILHDDAFSAQLAGQASQLAETYSWDGIAAKTVDLYRHLLNSEQSG
jgi:glycosyltransferase involved in cell wall biosynthesis